MSTGYSIPRAALPMDLFLDANEGALCADHADRRYPDTRALTRMLSELWLVPEDQLLVTAGGDDAIERVLRFALRERREALVPVPTFEMIERYVAGAGGRLVSVPYTEDGYPLQGILDKCSGSTGIIVVVSPNNPNGVVIRAEQWERLAAATAGIPKLVDLAYIEFADESIEERIRACPDAILVRTLSKAWGMAGLRIGAAIASEGIIRTLRSIGAPYPVSSASARLACERLVRSSPLTDVVRSERSRLTLRLRELGARVQTSQANFVLAEVSDPLWLRDACASLGIAVRAFPGKPLLERSVRISCPGEERAFQRLEAALACALAPEAILFDMDGVLADVSRSYRVAIQETVRAFGGSVDAQTVTRAKQAGSANDDWELSRRLLARQGIDVPLEEVTRCFERVYNERGLYRNEELCVDRLRLQQWSLVRPLGIVTGRPRRDAERFLRQHDIQNCFRQVITREDAPLKPDPAPVMLAMQRLGVRTAWLLGDTPDDIVAARRSGVLPLGVCAPGEDSLANAESLRLAGAARIWSSVSELEGVL
jgi:HAD superfamily hydrolase (TIGR01548 family)